MKRWALLCAAAAQLLAAPCRGAGNTDFFDAVRAGDGDKVKALLQADPKLAEARTDDGSTALHLAALEGHADIARQLLASGAQVNARGLRDETPLHMAVYDAHRELAEVLLEGKAEVNVQNTAGETPLHIAARKGHRDLVTLLVDHQADVNAKDRQDATPLHAAAAAGHKEVVQLLLKQNADPGARDKAGRTPKAAAMEKQHWEVVEVLTPRVGDFYDLQRFVFEGAKTFTPDALREGLKETSDFFELSHPLAPLEPYVEAMQRRLLQGYQHHGFADARIEAWHDAKAGRIVVKVEEGPRYRCGAVKVSGAQKVPAATIIERLTASRAKGRKARRAYDFKDRAPATSTLTQALARGAESSETPWVKGEPAPCSNPDLRDLKEEVSDLLHERGFLFAKVNVLVVPDKAAGTAELQVDVVEEGRHAVIGRIDVLGNKTNTAEAVLRYLDVKPGMEFSSQVAAAIEDRLWRAARFLSYKVSVGSPDTEGRIPLQIELAEYDQAPPLSKPFSETEQTMLKLREWLSKLDATGEDLVVKLSGLPAPAPEGELVLSPHSGVAFLVSDATRKAEPRDEYAVVLRAGEAGLYSPAGGRKLRLACPKVRLNAFLTVEAKAVATNESPFNLTVGAGFSSLKKSEPDASSYQFELTLPPVACAGLAHRWQGASWFDGDVLVRSNATMSLKVNASTGRILQLRMASETGDGEAQLRCEQGAFEHAVQRVQTATSDLPDVADTNAPLSSALAFLAREVCSSKYLRAFSGTNVLSKATAPMLAWPRQFKLEDILAPLNQLVGNGKSPGGQAEEFSVPKEYGWREATFSDVIAMITGWVLGHSDALLEPRSWPWTLLREAGLTLQGKGKYTDQVVTEIYESNQSGPLAYLAAAQLLATMQPPQARKFAARGLERLSAADFRRDWSMLLAGNSLLSQCCQRLAAALGELDEEHITELVKAQSPALGECLRECARRLRANKDQPLTEALGPALDAYWERELKDQVAAALKARSFDPANAFKEGLAAYRNESGDKSKAAKLFAQAAAHGHPGAQYYLGMLYERGTGVPRDMAAALDWYRQSATNGYSEAAVVLGNYYSDGLQVKQNHDRSLCLVQRSSGGRSTGWPKCSGTARSAS